MISRLLQAFGAVLLALVPVNAAATDTQAAASHVSDRAARKTQSQIDKLQRAYERHMKRCSSNDEYACDNARGELAQIQGLKADAPAAQ
jgi:hypothetical protein